MPKRTTRSTKHLPTQAAELAFAVPIVVAHRFARLMLAGPAPSPRDRREFQRMGAEKFAAFQESWLNMAFAALRTNQQLASSMLHSFWFPWTSLAQRGHVAAQLRHGMLAALGEGLAPVHRRAVANAKRLSRSRHR